MDCRTPRQARPARWTCETKDGKQAHNTTQEPSANFASAADKVMADNEAFLARIRLQIPEDSVEEYDDVIQRLLACQKMVFEQAKAMLKT